MAGTVRRKPDGTLWAARAAYIRRLSSSCVPSLYSWKQNAPDRTRLLLKRRAHAVPEDDGFRIPEQ